MSINVIIEIGLPRRVVNTKKEVTNFINTNNGIKAIFKTVYKFREMNGDKKPDYNSAIVNQLFFDFDTEDCWNEANKLHQFLLEENTKHNIFISGKGYHIFVLTEPYNPEHIKSTIYNAQHYFIDKMNLKCDPQVVGDPARLHRIPNTYNVKAKRFCIPLTQDQFKAGDDVIKIFAQQQNFIKDYTIGAHLFELGVFDIENKEIYNVDIDTSDFKSNLNDGYFDGCDDFIKQLLMKEEHGWNDRYLIILYFKERGFMRDEVFQILKEHLSERKFRHCVYEERQLQYLFERDDLMFPDKYGVKLYK